jgi:nicotinamide-nucleotide amidase
MDKNLRDLIADLAVGLMARKQVLGTAESCTGGLIGAFCTALPGSSEWFGGGIIAYSNDIKQRLLNVPQSVLERHGAVSLETARDMALGALSALKVDCAISVTGVAGPGGGSAEKPVGTVVIGLVVPSELGSRLAALPELADLDVPENRLEGMNNKRISGLADISRPGSHCYVAATHFFSGDRETIRMATVVQALKLLRDCMSK